METYRTLAHINNFTTAIQILIPMGLAMRAIRDIQKVYDQELGLWQAIVKVKKRVNAVVIAVTVSSIVGFIRAFY